MRLAIENWVAQTWADPTWHIVIITLLWVCAFEAVTSVLRYSYLSWWPWPNQRLVDWRACHKTWNDMKRTRAEERYRARMARRPQKPGYARFVAEVTPEPEKPVEAVSEPVMPFGRPTLETYHDGEFVETLRCSIGARCEGADLEEGTEFFRVPLAGRESPDDPFLVVCQFCTIVPAEVS